MSHNPQWWRDRISAYLTPILISTIGALLWFQWQSVSNTLEVQARAQATVSVQLATIQEQIRESQTAFLNVQTEIEQLQAGQRDHEHRITILEASHR